jgi:hypothetical protein
VSYTSESLQNLKRCLKKKLQGFLSLELLLAIVNENVSNLIHSVISLSVMELLES